MKRKITKNQSKNTDILRCRIGQNLLTNQQFLAKSGKNNRLEHKKQIFSWSNKRAFRADVLSLLTSALRPRLLSPSRQNSERTRLSLQKIENTEQTNSYFWSIFTANRYIKHQNLAKIVVLSTILFGFSMFLANFSTPVYADSLTLTIPSEPLSLDLNPSVNSGFSSTSSSFNLKTDNSSGYTISIKSKNESGDNSLINGSNKLTSITESTTSDDFKTNSKFLNTWGWLPSKLDSKDNSDYQTAPGPEEITIDQTTEANETGTDYDISLAAKVDGSTPTGKYKNTFVVTSVANPLKTKKMQEWNYNDCNSLEEHEVVELEDSRDGNTYKVAKLKDGKCWMIQNLRIINKTITSTDSDVSNDFNIPSSNLSEFMKTPWANYIENNAAYLDENANYGGYYTWYTATAGTGNSSLTSYGQEAPSSICPKGWRLPTSSSSTSDFRQLYDYYDSPATLVAEPVPAFTYAGDISVDTGQLNLQGSHGFYWSSSASGGGYVMYFDFHAGAIDPSFSGRRPNGFPVRCIAREQKKITDLQYLQDWGDLSADEKTQVLDSMEDGTNYTLRDKRDNAEYTVAKLKDGNLWMTRNLRIINRTLASSDSDVSSNFTIPASSNSGWSYNVYNTSKAYYTNNIDYGSLYTWYTATTGEGTSSKTSGETSHSICPKGWRLPANSEFSMLTSTYSQSEAQLDVPNFGSKSWAGNCALGDCTAITGILGGWWSSTTYNSDNAYYLVSGSSNFKSIYNGKGYGFSVRCVAR